MSKPAFPRPYSEWVDGVGGIKHELPQQQGMTLLEYYAGQAEAGVSLVEIDTLPHNSIAQKCFHLAEAMIAEAEKRSK